MAKIQGKQKDAKAKADAEKELLEKAVALAEANGIEVSEDDTLETLTAKLKESGVESASVKDEVDEIPPVAAPVSYEIPVGAPKNAVLVDCSDEQAIEYQKKGKLVSSPNKGKAWVIPAILFAVALFSGVAQAAIGDEAVLGQNRWRVNTSGNLLPGADSSYEIGANGNEVKAISVDTLTAGVLNYATSTSLTFEGATADDYETTLSVTDPTADRSVVFADGPGTVMLSSLATNAVDAANSVTGASNGLVFEGAGVDAHEAIIQATDPTADTIWALPVAAAGTYSLMSSTLATNALDVANSVTGASNALVFEGATADAHETSIVPTDATADRTLTLPNATGTVSIQGAAAVALTPGVAVTLTVAPGKQIFTDTITTDNENQTINSSGAGSVGDEMTIIFTSDAAGSGDEIITFGTNMLSTGTLTLANVAADVYVVTFISNGSTWIEKSRTAVQTTA